MKIFKINDKQYQKIRNILEHANFFLIAVLILVFIVFMLQGFWKYVIKNESTNPPQDFSHVQLPISEYQFRCPEEYESIDEYLDNTGHFINYYQEKYPDLTLEELLDIRYEELVSHNCEKTLKNIANVNIGILPEKTDLDSDDGSLQKYIISPANSFINFMDESFGPYTREIDDYAKIKTIYYSKSDRKSRYIEKDRIKKENIFRVSVSQRGKLASIGIIEQDIDNMVDWLNAVNPDTGVNYTIEEVLGIPEVQFTIKEKQQIGDILTRGGQSIMPEEIVLNLYLEGIYDTKSFSVQDIAEIIINNLDEETILENYFEAPDPISGGSAFIIVSSSVYPDERYGQASLIKVASMDNNIYSLSFSRDFITNDDFSSLLSSKESYKESDFLRDIITMWFIKNMEAYGNELSNISPSNDWIDYFQEEPIQYSDLTNKQLQNYIEFYKDLFVVALREILDKEKEIAKFSIYDKNSITLKSVVLTYDYYNSKFIVTAIKSLSDKEKEITIIFQDKPDKVFIAQIYDNRISNYGEYYLKDFYEYPFDTAEEKENFLKRYTNFIADEKYAL